MEEETDCCVCVCVCVCVCPCMYVCVCVYAWTYVCIQACTRKGETYLSQVKVTNSLTRGKDYTTATFPLSLPSLSIPSLSFLPLPLLPSPSLSLPSPLPLLSPLLETTQANTVSHSFWGTQEPHAVRRGETRGDEGRGREGRVR